MTAVLRINCGGISLVAATLESATMTLKSAATRSNQAAAAAVESTAAGIIRRR